MMSVRGSGGVVVRCMSILRGQGRRGGGFELLRRLVKPLQTRLRDVKPPNAERHPTVLSCGNKQWGDDYHWLANPTHDRVRVHLKQENRYVEDLMAADRRASKTLAEEAWRPFREQSAVAADDGSLVDINYFNGYIYYTLADMEVRRRVTADGLGEPQVLCSEDAIAAYLGGSFHHIRALEVSPNNKMAALVVDVAGNDRCTALVFRLHHDDNVSERNAESPAFHPPSKETIEQVATHARARDLWQLSYQPQPLDVVLALDDVFSCKFAGKGHSLLVYTKPGDLRLPDSLFCVDVETPAHPPWRLASERDARFFLDIVATKDHRFLTLNSNSKDSSEVTLIPTNSGWLMDQKRVPARAMGRPTCDTAVDIEDTRDQPTVLCARDTCHYFVEHTRDHLYIITDADAAHNYKVCRAPVQSPTKKHWTDIVPASDWEAIKEGEMFSNHLVLKMQSSEGLPFIRIVGLDSGTHTDVHLPKSLRVCCLETGLNRDVDSDVFKFSVTTPLHPRIDYSCRLLDGALEETNCIPCPPHLDFDPSHFVCTREWTPCQDESDVSIPITLVHQRDARTGAAEGPVLAITYGAYGEDLHIGFDEQILPLLNRGWTVAYCHVRGGGELGSHWHQQGRREHKENSIRDYLRCLKFLCAEGIASEGRIVGYGTSAGGFAVAAACNWSPELFGGLILKVPFVDVLNAMADPALPLTAHETEEWGDPHNEEDFQWLKRMCPYQNVSQQPYPPMFICAGLQDDRVKFWQAAKYAAKVRAKTTSGNPVMLFVDESGGHYTGTPSVLARQLWFALRVACQQDSSE